MNRPTIFTVTLNPSLDRTLRVPVLVPGTIHRGHVVRDDLGGKGINVSRALRALGIPSRIVGVFGGRNGRMLRDALATEGYQVTSIEVIEETRCNLTLYDESTCLYTKINEPGPCLGPAEVEQIEACVERLTRPGDFWALCGSLPPGAPDDLYARLVMRIQSAEAFALLDTSGPALTRAVRAVPYAIKPNLDEATALLGMPVREGDDESQRRAVRALGSCGTPIAMLTSGAHGLLLAADRQLWSAVPPEVPVRSTVGAGDAALAGLLWAVWEGCGPEEIARRSVACGTAAAMQEGTGVGDASLVRVLLPQVLVTTIH